VAVVLARTSTGLVAEPPLLRQATTMSSAKKSA
jgi:hypothetical protein